jgi:hypothetical protein
VVDSEMLLCIVKPLWTHRTGQMASAPFFGGGGVKQKEIKTAHAHTHRVVKLRDMAESAVSNSKSNTLQSLCVSSP